jgi:hypothetical protein
MQGKTYVLTISRLAVQLEQMAEVGWVAKYSNAPPIPQNISRPPEILHDFSKLRIYNYCYVKNSSLSYTARQRKVVVQVVVQGDIHTSKEKGARLQL